MRIICHCIFFLLFLSGTIKAQSAADTRTVQGTELSVSEIFPVTIKGAQYDSRKKMMPFFQLTHATPKHAAAKPSLVVKRTRLVNDKIAVVIKNHFADFIRSDFQISGGSGISRYRNMNHYRLYPYRFNASNQLEELLEYEIRWTVSSNEDLAARHSSSSFVSTSVLQSGIWFKIGVTRTGIHRISRTFLSSMGISSAKLDPRKIRIYGNGGKMLPELNKAPRIDDLHEIPIMVVDGGDGSFDNSDYVLFYATGPNEWKKNTVSNFLKFQPVKNLYSDTSFYFVNVDLGDGKRIGVQPSAGSNNVSTTTYDYYNFHEQELINLAKSGRHFLGESFDFVNTRTITFDDGDYVVGDSLVTFVSLAATSASFTSSFEVTGNGIVMGITTSPVGSGTYANYAAWGINSSGVLNTVGNQITVSVTKKTQQSAAWLDKIVVNARRHLILRNRQYNFRDLRVSNTGNVARFTITSASPQGTQLWNVTDPVNPFVQAYDIVPGGLAFAAPADSVNEYCVVPAGDYYTPSFVGRVANQNLHGLMQTDFLIITHPLFLREAQRLGNFHQQKEGYSYFVATVDQIYNEFSSGRPDVSAIRDFIRMVYTRNENTQGQLRFVCLMGDGSYNNRSRNLVNNSNLIPTYQSVESFSHLNSVATDDFYAMMEPDEGPFAEEKGNVDIGMGRFPCRTVSEVQAILNKIEKYYSKDPGFSAGEKIPISGSASQSTMGDWRTWNIFLADDEDAALHMWQADSLARYVRRLAPGFNNDKILLDAYQRFSTPGGHRYPDARLDLDKRVKKGTLIFNYTGHGGEVGLTAERLVDIEMINGFDNFNRLPLFITATCEFSRYDDPNRTSAGELCLLNPKGGAIAMMTTCRLAFAHTNFQLNWILIEKLFSRLPNGQRPALGTILMETKAEMPGQAYFANFHLLGDPALTLSYPEYQVHTTHINGVQLNSSSSDTLKALAKVTVQGNITDLSGNKLDFNGVVYPTVFDKEQLQVALLNSRQSAVNYDQYCDTCSTPLTFNIQKNILYRGKATASHGDFSFTFLVPKDISFSYGTGKISYYASTGEHDAMGYYDRVLVGGESGNIVADNEGPQVELFINEKNFVNGGTTDENPILYADLIDSSGINTSGIGLGHDLTVILDEKTDKPIILNDYYEANLNSYQSGRLRYPFSQLAEGPHSISFKAWDIQNNSSVVALDFIVAKRAELALRQVLNYPNPFTTRTKFFFQHNQSGTPLKVHIQVYTVSGRLVKTIQQTVVSESFMSEGIDWDGRDDYGDKLARGVYIYKLAVLDIYNKKAEKIEKLVILN